MTATEPIQRDGARWADVEWLLAECDRLSAALGVREQELSEAAHEINCAGPVAHGIRVLKQENAAAIGAVGRLIDERDEARAESARLLQALDGLRNKIREFRDGTVARDQSKVEQAQVAAIQGTLKVLECELDQALASSARVPRED